MDDLLEKTFSHYRVVTRLGAGGMGVVYRAHDARLDRDVALKVLPEYMMKDESARARLLNEARASAALSHPHIAHVYDTGHAHGHMFFAMELIEGKPLKEVIPRGGLPLSTVCRYGEQIARALAFAHEHGIIHRDLKTANIMITPDGQAKVLDFGLAKRAMEPREKPDPGLTATGTILGTPNYLPPEVLLGGAADARSDIWALGVVLYEMISGKLPFDGSSMAELAGAIVNEAPNPLSGRVPTGIQLVIARCLSKDPNGRYRSASEVAAALQALDPEGARGSSGGASSRPGAWRSWAMALGTVAILAIFLAVHTGDIQKRLRGDGGTEANASATPHIGSLAVLPLVNLSGDPSQEYFADGMTDELITNLAPIRSLKVISRTSVMPFKKSNKSLKEIAAALDVDAIVEGSVLRAGDKVRITAQLIQAAQDRHLWAKSYLFGDWNWKEAEHHVQHAIQLNAGYSTAHLVDAVILSTEGRFNEAIEQDRLALQLDPLSLIMNWNAAATYFYARRYDEAIAQAKHTMELDPLSPLPHGALVMSYEQTGRFQEMMDVLEKAMPPGLHDDARAMVARLRAAYAKDGPAGYWRESLAIQEAQQRRGMGDDVRLAMLFAKTGQREKALETLEHALAEHSGDLIFLNVTPCFDSIRAEPRFRAIIRRVGPPAA